MGFMEIPAVQKWLGRFSDKDAPAALALLQSIRIVSEDTFLLELESNARNVARRVNGPVALYVAREMKAGETYFKSRSQQPKIIDAPEEIGSEGTLAYLATQMNRSSPNIFLNHPSLDTIAELHCRDLMIFDDVSTSGDRIVEFVDSLMRSKTLMSWWSFWRISIHVVVYGITAAAERRVRSTIISARSTRPQSKLTFTYTRRPTSSRDLWDPSLTVQVEDVCRRYGQEAGANPFSVLGYGNTMGNLIFYHGCPDNAPGILWHTENGWPALFPERSVPDVFKTGGDHAGPQHGLVHMLELLNAGEIGVGNLFHRLSPLGQKVLLFLAAVRNKAGRHDDRLLEATGFSYAECNEVRGFASINGLIDSHGQLTKRGRQELLFAEKCGSLPFEPPVATGGFYYPRSLRAARD